MLYLSNTIISPHSYGLVNSVNDLTKGSIQLDANIEYQWIYQRFFNESGLNQLFDLITNEYKCLLKGKISRILTVPVNYTFDVGVILVNDMVLSLCNYSIDVTTTDITFNKSLTWTDRINELKYLPYKNNMVFTMKVTKSDTYTFNDFGFDIILK